MSEDQQAYIRFLEAAIERVRRLHEQSGPICYECGTAHPCMTIETLDGNR